jgi:hypothetical protein
MTEADEARYLAEIGRLRQQLAVVEEALARSAEALGRVTAERDEARARLTPASLPPAGGSEK